MISRILVRAPNWIGDQILAFPFFHYLRKAYPRAQITVACVPWVKEIQFLDCVNDVCVLPQAHVKGFWPKWKALNEGARLLKNKDWDLAIALPNSFSAGWLIWRSGAKVRRGYAVDGRSVLLNEKVTWDPAPGIHRSQAYVNLLPDPAQPKRPMQEFWGILPENPLDSIIPGEKEEFDPQLSWRNVVPVEPPAENFWVLAPGATAESRRWPLERFAQLAHKIREETGWIPVIVGGPQEVPLVERLRRDFHVTLKDLTARGPVSAFWKVFRSAKLSVCNESGLSHVAALCGSPVQIICGAANPTRTRPLGPGRVQVMVNPVECWPCERNQCLQLPEKKLQCLKGIYPDAVWEEIQRLLAA